MFGANSRKARSKYKPHPIFGSTINPLQPIIQFFSPKKTSSSADDHAGPSLAQQDSIVLPGSYPLSPKPPTTPDPFTPPSSATPASSASSANNPNTTTTTHDRRKKRLERTKSRMAQPRSRHSSSLKGSVRSHNSKSFERLHKSVNKTLKPISESMNEEDRIFLNQMEKIMWTHKYRTGLVECRDTAERAPNHASDMAKENDEKLAQLREEEKEVRVKLERQVSAVREQEEARRAELEQRRTEIEKVSRVVEEKAKEGEIKRERTKELIRFLNQSELDIMTAQAATTSHGLTTNHDHLRIELEKIAEARRLLQEEQAAYRHQVDEVSAARAELEESKRQMQEEEEASRVQAAARAAGLEAMFEDYRRLRSQIRQLQDETETAKRKSDDVLMQARVQTKRLRREHERELKETEEKGARRVAEVVMGFQARLYEEAEARRRAEDHATAATAAAARAEAMMFAAASGTHQHEHPGTLNQSYGQWRPPPEYEMASPPPQPPQQPPPSRTTAPPPPSPPPPHPQQQQHPHVPTDSDRIVLYERKWEALKGDAKGVLFDQIPWPVLIDLTQPGQLDITLIRKFLNHQVYLSLPGMAGKSLRERIKGEMLRWHPDKFSRVLPKMDPSQRAAIKATAEEVVKLFTQLMREGDEA